MSIRKNTWDLDGHYDLTNSGLNSYEEPGYLFSWGRNQYGELGLNDLTYRSSPVQIPGSQWKFLYTSRINAYATKDDGTLWGWGQAFWGQLGLNTNGNGAGNGYRSSPTQIPGTQWNTIATGRASVVASKTDGTLWSWGYNLVTGNLGLNDVASRSSPVQIPGTQWTGTLSCAYDAFFATKTDNTLWSWGYNYYGDLGLNDRIYRSSPTQVPGTQWNIVEAGRSSVVASKTDGTSWVWGANGWGQLGLNNKTYYSSPIQIPGTQWSGFFLQSQFSLLTKTDGTLWAMGDNRDGSLGQNDVISYSSPIQVPGTQWSGMGNNGNSGPRPVHVLMKKTDNTLWSWGVGAYGKLGQNNTIKYSSPTQIPGTQWNSAATGLNQTIATKYAP